MDRLHRRLGGTAASALLALAPLSLVGCAANPTAPANVDAITLVNTTPGTVHVVWCAGGGENACAEERDMEVLPSGATRQVDITSDEELLRLDPAAGPERFVCEDDAPGSRIALTPSYPTTQSAYDHCVTGPSAT